MQAVIADSQRSGRRGEEDALGGLDMMRRLRECQDLPVRDGARCKRRRRAKLIDEREAVEKGALSANLIFSKYRTQDGEKQGDFRHPRK